MIDFFRKKEYGPVEFCGDILLVHSLFSRNGIGESVVVGHGRRHGEIVVKRLGSRDERKVLLETLRPLV